MTAVDVVAGADRAAWLAARRQGIGGSDAAAVVGLSPWASPMSCYFEKRGEVTTDWEPTEQMLWGLRLEGVVAQVWSEETGRPLQRFEPYTAMRWHPEIPFMFANLDGVVLDDHGREVEGWECKTESGWAAHDWDDGPPNYVQVQCQHQMAVTGHPRTQGAVLLDGRHMIPWTIERDEELITSLIEAERVFWQRVQEGRPPRADSHPSTGQALKARWEETLDEAVELGEEGLALVAQRHRAYAAKKSAEGEQEEAENRLRQLLGECEVGTVFDKIAVTWRPTKAGYRTLDVKKIA